MILQVMAAYDKKARAFCYPFYVAHVDVGIRSFEAAVNGENQVVTAHPEDYALFLLGTWSDENGLFEVKAIPTHVVEAMQLKRPNGQAYLSNEEGKKG